MTRRDWFIFALTALVITVAALPVVTYPLGRDQGIYATVGAAILRGGAPYSDIWELKPPAIHYIYALGITLFGQQVRALDLVIVPLTALGLYMLGKRLNGSGTAFLAALIFPVFYLSEHFANLTQSDSFVTLPMTWAVVCALRAANSPLNSRSALVYTFMAGMLCAGSLWFKHYYIFFVIGLALHHMLARRRLPLKEAFVFAAGGILVGGGGVAYLLARGILDDMLATAGGAARYTASGTDLPFLQTMLHYFSFRWQYWGVMLVLAAAWLPLRLYAPKLNDTGWRIVFWWLLGGLGFLFIQGKGFDTHWIPMLPPLSLLAAGSLAQMLAGLKLVRIGYAAAALGFVAVLIFNTWGISWGYITGRESQQDYYARFQANDVKPAETLQVVNFLRERVLPGDTLYIWGLRPEVFFLSELRPATRFVAHVALIGDWYPQAWKQENVDVLWAALPPYVLVMQSDNMPWVMGGINADSHTLLVAYTELNNWLAYNYERETQIGDFLIWRRKS